jgi:cytidyltransferase-like protein
MPLLKSAPLARPRQTSARLGPTAKSAANRKTATASGAVDRPPHSKIISFEEAALLCPRLRAKGRVIVQCHGTFDLIHPGHVVHFEEAKALGDILVVTITGEKFVNKGPGRPYFNDQLRSRWLAALQCVDYVVVIPYAAAVEAVRCVRPNFYCKGREYADPINDLTGNICDDIEVVQEVGGEMRYLGSILFSSTRLLNQHFDPYPADVKAFCRGVAAECTPGRFRDMVDAFAKLRVLVVGDIIFDRYTTLEVQGLTSKNRILSGRYISDDLQAGGALAVYRHLREFTPHVKIAALAGTEPWLEDTLRKFVEPDGDEIVRSREFTTVVKQRFVEPRVEGKELAKLFSVNFIDARPPAEALQRQLLERIAGQIANYDLVLVMDFGHGVMEDLLRHHVQEKAPFLAVNCQTNSNNHGFNIINRRYRRADAFTVDQAELNLAVGRRHIDYGKELTVLSKSLGSSYAWLTRGAHETLGRNCVKDISACPPFERTVVDTLGAGDAFCAVASLAAASRVPLNIATFMGQLAGAQAVKITGNSEPIRKIRLLKGGMSMLAF